MIVASARGHLGILEVVFPPGLAPRAPERFREGQCKTRTFT
jgi:hypothetical protein